MAHVGLPRIGGAVDPAELQAHALALLRQEAVIGAVGDAEDQHLAVFRRELEGGGVARIRAQHAQPSALVRPFLAEAEDHGDDLAPGIGMRIALVVVAAGRAHHHQRRRAFAEVDGELGFDQFAEARAREILQRRREIRSVFEVGNRIGAAMRDMRTVGQHRLTLRQPHRLTDEGVFAGVAMQRRG